MFDERIAYRRAFPGSPGANIRSVPSSFGPGHDRMPGRDFGVNPRGSPAVGRPFTAYGVEYSVRLRNGDQGRIVDPVARRYEIGAINVADEVLVGVAPLLDGLVAVDYWAHDRCASVRWGLHGDQLILGEVVAHGCHRHLQGGRLAVQVSQLLVDRDVEGHRPAGGHNWCGRWRGSRRSRGGWRGVFDHE